jgi:hypothetical protein
LERRLRQILLTACYFAVASHMPAYGQASPAATPALQLSVFGGITGTDTGLASGKNLGLTGGAGLRLPPFRALYPELEFRGTYAIDDDGIDRQKNVLAGAKIAAHLGRLQPYGDFLFGRGEISYPGSGYQVPGKPIFYTQSSSIVLSPGGGLDLNLSKQWALKMDLQVQRYSTPVAETGHIYATSGALGIVYRFDFNHHTTQKER